MLAHFKLFHPMIHRAKSAGIKSNELRGEREKNGMVERRKQTRNEQRSTNERKNQTTQHKSKRLNAAVNTNKATRKWHKISSSDSISSSTTAACARARSPTHLALVKCVISYGIHFKLVTNIFSIFYACSTIHSNCKL